MSDAKHDQHGKKDAGHGSSGAGGKGGHGDEGSGKKKHGGHGGGGGHGAPHEEHEGAPEWLISFADMVMLMMGFFVILFALNVQPKGGNPGGAGEEAEGVALSPAQLDYVIALRRAFNNPVDPMGMDPDDARLRERMKASEQGGAGESRDAGDAGKDKNVTTVRPGERSARGTNVMFGSGSANLSNAAQKTIDELAKRIDGQNTLVEVYGHVGAGEIVGDPERAMRLSIDRAMIVSKRLVAGGLDFWRIRIRGAGDGDRVEPFPSGASTDAHNQRVEIEVLDKSAPPKEPIRSMAAPAPVGRRAD